MTRYRWLWPLLILVLVMAACGGDSDDGNDNETSSATNPLAAEIDRVLIVTVGMTPEENRLAVSFQEGVKRYPHVEGVYLMVRNPEDSTVVWEGELTTYTDYDGKYWVGYPDFPAPGVWQFDILARSTDPDVEPHTFTMNAEVYTAADTAGLLPGEVAPPSQTLTLADMQNGDLMTITSDATPIEDYYRLSIADAVSSDKPSVVIFATPELCTREICASTLESIDPVREVYGDSVNFVHVEIYDQLTGKKVDVLHEWDMYDTKWPWIFLVDESGMIQARYDGLVGFDELKPAIDALLGEGDSAPIFG